MGIFEMLPVSDAIRTLIQQRASAGDLREVARTEGMRSLRDDGWRLLVEGRTTVQELVRVTKDERSNGRRTGRPDEGA